MVLVVEVRAVEVGAVEVGAVEVRAVEVGAVEVGAVAEVMVVPHFSPLAVTGEETIDNFKLQRSVSGVHLYNIV